MPKPSVHVEVTKIDGSYPGLDDLDQNLINHVSFRLGTYLSYSTNDDDIQAIPQMMSKSAHYVQHEVPTDVLRIRDDYQSTLELATREWTGYGASQDRDSALEKWTSLASSAPDVPRRIKAQAHSCLAAVWFDRATEDSERWNIDSLYRAGSNADEAISLGLISPAALRAGFSIESQGFRRPEDNRFPGLSTERFERLSELWEAIDMRMAEVNKAAAKRDAKVSKAPLKYVCAADDCGIQATKKSGLLRCAGKCPVVYKPSYCSKECQKMDWKRHKPFCKANAKKSSVPSLNASNDTGEDTVRRTTRSEDKASDTFPGRAPGYSIEVPLKHGGTMQLHSKTLGPHMMREFRKVAEDRNGR